jgi:hypothetical protein
MAHFILKRSLLMFAFLTSVGLFPSSSNALFGLGPARLAMKSVGAKQFGPKFAVVLSRSSNGIVKALLRYDARNAGPWKEVYTGAVSAIWLPSYGFKKSGDWPIDINEMGDGGKFVLQDKNSLTFVSTFSGELYTITRPDGKIQGVYFCEDEFGAKVSYMAEGNERATFLIRKTDKKILKMNSDYEPVSSPQLIELFSRLEHGEKIDDLRSRYNNTPTFPNKLNLRSYDEIHRTQDGAYGDVVFKTKPQLEKTFAPGTYWYGDLKASLTHTGALKVVDATSGDLVFKGVGGGIPVAVTVSARYVAIAFSFNSVHIYQRGTSELIKKIELPNELIEKVSFSPSSLVIQTNLGTSLYSATELTYRFTQTRQNPDALLPRCSSLFH